MPSQEEASKKPVHRVPPVPTWLFPGLTVLLAVVGVGEFGLAIISASSGDFNIWALVAALTGFFTCAVCAWMWRQQVLDARDNQPGQL
jgi:hypothetical protein